MFLFSTLIPGVLTALFDPSSPICLIIISACLWSASYSILSGCHVTILLRILMDFMSFSPDPILPLIFTSNLS